MCTTTSPIAVSTSTDPDHRSMYDYRCEDRWTIPRQVPLPSRVPLPSTLEASVDIKFLGGAEAGFTELWSGTGKAPLRGKPMWEVGIVTGDSNTVQVPYIL